MNEWSDANIYFNVGKCIFNGRTLYAEAFDHKGPLIFFIYGLGYLISNTTFHGVFIFELLSGLMLVSAVYLTAGLYLRKEYAFVVAILTMLVMLLYSHTGGAPEEFILAFVAISLFLFLHHFKGHNVQHRASYMIWHGVLFAATVFTKINLAVFWVFPVAAIFLMLLLNKEYKNLFVNLLSFLVGVFIITLPLLSYFYVNNALSDAYETYIVLNSKYGRLNEPMLIISRLAYRMYLDLQSDAVSFVLIMAGVFYFPFKFLDTFIQKISIFLAGLSLYLMIYIAPSFYFYYPLPMVSFVSLGVIVFLKLIADVITLRSSRMVLALVLCFGLLFGIQRKALFQTGGLILLRIDEPDGVVTQFSKIIVKEKNPTFANFGVGEENAIFTRCNIVPNVKYFITPNITRNMWPDMIKDRTKNIEDKALDFIVLTNTSADFIYFKYLDALAQNYELVDTYIDKRYHMQDDHFISYLYKKKN